MSVRPPVLVSAGAGSGKTWRIVKAVVDRVRAGAAVHEVAAVTFTEAAAAELQDRIRAGLLAHGMAAEAARVDGATVCTIHRFALTLLQRYPLAASVPAHPSVLDEEQAASLRRNVLADVVRQGEAPELRALLEGLFGPGVGLAEQAWGDAGTPVERLQLLVRELLEKCRSVAMAPPRVRREGDRAATRLLDAMGPPGDGDALDGALRDALAAALDALDERPEPAFKKDVAFYEALRASRASTPAPFDLALRFAGGDLSKPAALAFAPLLAASNEAAHHHPELRRRLAAGVRGVYALTATVMERYQAEKARIGALDFEDMQAMALALLGGGAYAELVAATTPFVVVDEFQDTSPLQFRLFEALREAGAEVHYVGDLKQGIYGFRTADSALFAALLDRARDEGGGAESLDRSRRSRPELVAFTNALFAEVLPAQGIAFAPLTADNDYARGACPTSAPSIDVVRAGAPTEARVRAGVDRVVELMASGTPVLDRATGAARAPRWGDFAVLAYTHDTLRRWGEALRARGIPAVLASRGLYDTLEVTLARAWLRMLSSPRDTAAAASVLLSELYGVSQRTMARAALLRVTGSPRRALELSAADPEALPLTAFEARALARCHDDLTTCREAFRQLPLHEAVERALERVELASRLSLRLSPPEAAQVRANLAELVAVAWRLARRTDAGLALDGATGATLENYLLALDRDARRDPWQPHPGDGEGVRLVTAHAAKGMEYPIVVLDLLAQRLQVRLPRVEVVRPEGRDALLARDALDASGVQLVPDVGAGAWRDRFRDLFDGALHQRQEWARLLYVAVTRAREHLVLVWPDEGKGATASVHSLLSERAPEAPASGRGEARWCDVAVTVIRARAAAPEAPARAEPDLGAWRALCDDEGPEAPEAREIAEVAPRLARVSPSELCQVADCPEVPRLVRFARGEIHAVARSAGVPVAVRAIPDARAARSLLGASVPATELGKLVHAAVERARLLGDASGDAALARDVLRAAAATEHADALASLIVETLASVRGAVAALGATEEPSSEVPFVMDLAGTTLHGIVDLVVRAPDGLHVVDLKTHLIDDAELGLWAAYYRPQLDAYALAVERLSGEAVVGRHLAIPASGALVTLVDAFVASHAEVALASYGSLLAGDVPGPAQDCARCGWNELCRVGKSVLAEERRRA